MGAAAGNRTQPQGLQGWDFLGRRAGWAIFYNINFNAMTTSISSARCPASDFVSHCGSLAAPCCANRCCAHAGGFRVVRGRRPPPTRVLFDAWAASAARPSIAREEQARPLKTVNASVGAQHLRGSDRRWCACSPGLMRGLLGHNRYRLGQWPVRRRDGAARRWAQCTVGPPQEHAVEC